MEKHSVWRLSYLFAHLHLLSSDSFSSTLLSSSLSLLSASALLCFSSVHIVGSLTSKLPSIMVKKIHHGGMTKKPTTSRTTTTTMRPAMTIAKEATKAEMLWASAAAFAAASGIRLHAQSISPRRARAKAALEKGKDMARADPTGATPKAMARKEKAIDLTHGDLPKAMAKALARTTARRASTMSTTMPPIMSDRLWMAAMSARSTTRSCGIVTDSHQDQLLPHGCQ